MDWRTEREYCGKPQLFGCEFLGGPKFIEVEFLKVWAQPELTCRRKRPAILSARSQICCPQLPKGLTLSG